MTEAYAEEVIERWVTAWSRGDLDALESILDPAVTLRAMQPGPWDCDNRVQVMQLLRPGKLTEARATRAAVRCAESTTTPTSCRVSAEVRG